MSRPEIPCSRDHRPACRARNREDALDVEAIAWAEIHKSLGTFSPEKGSPTAWLLGIASKVLARNLKNNEDWTRLCLLISQMSDEVNDYDDLGDAVAAVALVATPLELGDIGEYLLRAIVEVGGYPWQVIAFGFNRILKWDPQSMMQGGHQGGLSDKDLLLLEKRLRLDCADLFKIYQRQVAPVFVPLQQKMSVTVADLVPSGDARTTQLTRAFAHAMVGITVLSQYWGGNPAHTITDWGNKVKTRVRDHALKDTEFLCLVAGNTGEAVPTDRSCR